MLSAFFNAAPLLIYAVPIFVLLLLILVSSAVRVILEYERAVVFTLGRFERVKGPGLILLYPFIQQMVRVDLRIQVEAIAQP